MTSNNFPPRYKVIRPLGQGGMGKVYLAEDLELGRRIALKLLSEDYTADPKLRARLKHEAQAAAAINHPHVVTIYDFGQHEGNFYIAMEYVDGQSLKDLLEEDLELAKVIDIAIQIGEGLNEAHQAGVVHRDLKPANILINRKGQVKIADFGVALLKDATKLTAEGYWLGTIAYTSPEQVKGHEVDRRTDVFSFGIVLYELLTRQLPFKGEAQAAVINAILNKEPGQFPWGEGSASKMRANFGNNAVGPVAVDSYPTGATLEGVFNLGGNVWEWCDAWSDYTQAERVILGGAWNFGPDDMRLAFRNGERPEENQRNDVGFRVIRAIQ